VSACEDGPRTRPGQALSGHQDWVYARVRRQHGGSEGIWPAPHDRAGCAASAPRLGRAARAAFRGWDGDAGGVPGLVGGAGGWRSVAGERGGRPVLRGGGLGGGGSRRVQGGGAEMIIAVPGAGQGGKAQIKGLAVTLDQGERGNNYRGEGAGPSP
jgi:hypothetical protein